MLNVPYVFNATKRPNKVKGANALAPMVDDRDIVFANTKLGG